jgi:hypothetical protein
MTLALISGNFMGTPGKAAARVRGADLVDPMVVPLPTSGIFWLVKVVTMVTSADLHFRLRIPLEYVG